MFEHFSFGTSSQTSSYLHQDTPDPSPRDISHLNSSQPLSEYPFPDTKPSTVSSIITRFSAQSLTPEMTGHSQTLQLSPPSSHPYGNPAPATPIEEHARSRSPCRRLQRQLNMQLQTSNTHMRDIGALVSDMITGSTQCIVHSPSSCSRPYAPTIEPNGTAPLEVDTSILSTPSTPEHSLLPIDEGFHDEGFHDDDALLEWDDINLHFPSLQESLPFTLLRTGVTSGGIRKFGDGRFKICFTRSKDILCEGRPKIRNKPRMRRRQRMKDV